MIDVNVTLDYCAKHQPYFAAARDAIALCRFRGGRLWLYSGSVQTLEYNLCAELRRGALAKGENHTTRQIASRSRALLKDFSQDKRGSLPWRKKAPFSKQPTPKTNN